MMKNIIFISIFFFSFPILFGQNKIKSVKKIQLIGENSNDSTLIFEKEYDSLGHITRKVIHVVDGHRVYYHYEYNEEGYLINVDTIGLLSNLAFIYDTENNNTNNILSENKKFSFTKEGIQLLMEKRIEYRDSSFSNIYYRYDTNCLLTQKIEVYYNKKYNDCREIITEYKYDKNNNLIEEFFVDKKHSIYDKSIFIYSYW